MDNKGQMGAVYGIIFALISIFAMYLFLTMWSPIVGMLFPLLDNAETISMGGPAKLFIMLVPIILVFSIIIGLLLSIRGERQQQPPAY